MLVDDVRARGSALHWSLYGTDIDEEKVVKQRQQGCRRYTDSRQLIYKAKGSVVVVQAGAHSDAVGQQVCVSKCEGDGKDPIQSRKREHGSGEGKEPFP
jgi:hypothetical protein